MNFEIGDPFALPGSEGYEQLVAQEVERKRLASACVARPGGHRWEIEGIPEETPNLRCADCPVWPDDLFDDFHNTLTHDSEFQVGGRTVRFDQELAGVQSNYFIIPVDVELEAIVHPGGPWGGPEYDVAVSITDRGQATA